MFSIYWVYCVSNDVSARGWSGSAMCLTCSLSGCRPPPLWLVPTCRARQQQATRSYSQITRTRCTNLPVLSVNQQNTNTIFSIPVSLILSVFKGKPYKKSQSSSIMFYQSVRFGSLKLEGRQVGTSSRSVVSGWFGQLQLRPLLPGS